MSISINENYENNQPSNIKYSFSGYNFFDPSRIGADKWHICLDIMQNHLKELTLFFGKKNNKMKELISDIISQVQADNLFITSLKNHIS